jgi:hypothetical protein
MIRNRGFHSGLSGSILQDRKPGPSRRKYGQITWRVAATCLQQGKPVVDILYYYGENSNITQAFAQKLPSVPGYEYDFANSTVIKSAIKIEGGKIVATSGQQYRLLVLDSTAKNMTLPVLKKLGELVAAGMKVAGTKPENSPSMSDNRLNLLHW